MFSFEEMLNIVSNATIVYVVPQPPLLPVDLHNLSFMADSGTRWQ